MKSWSGDWDGGVVVGNAWHPPGTGRLEPASAGTQVVGMAWATVVLKVNQWTFMFRAAATAAQSFLGHRHEQPVP